LSSVGVVFAKEVRDLWRRPGVIVTMLVPFALLTAMAVLSLYAADHTAGGTHGAPHPHLPAMLKGATPREIAQFMVLGQFILVWLLIPISVSAQLAAHAVVGEKEEGTLEPLLATPISTGALLLGKTLASGLPGIALVWLSWLVTWLAGRPLTTPRVLMATVFSSEWLFTLALMVPGLTLLTVMLLVAVSARVNDVRTASQIGGLLVLPVVMAFVVMVSRGVALGNGVVLMASASIWVLALILLVIAIRVFQRESILVRWKQAR